MKLKKLIGLRNMLLGAAAITVVGFMAAGDANATNGMNLEGYGPIAMGMGGASMAYDNGTAATMNNPATIGLSEGHEFDLALGFLGPDVSAIAPGGMPVSESDGDAYYMPAVGWKSTKGKFTYGIGVFGQGGMGTEYPSDSFLALGTGDVVRSEVSVGRAMIPVAYNVSERLTIGGTVDFVWAGMDIKMAIDSNQFFDFISPTPTFGTAGGAMLASFNQAVGSGFLNDGTGAGDGAGTGPLNWARFDFSNDNDFTGEARGYGVAGKIGMTYKVTQDLTLGATYHSKTAMEDLEANGATVTFNVNADPTGSGTYTATTIPVTGDIQVRDFEWPDMFGIGAAYNFTERFMMAADVKLIRWENVLENFNMTFTPNEEQANPLAAGFAGELDVTLFQKWEDQVVVSIGGAYKVTDKVTVRAGYNHANNPIDTLSSLYLNPLFPAIVMDHITAGLGVDFNESHHLNLATSFALEEEVTAGADGVTSTHGQFSWQVMYTFTY